MCECVAVRRPGRVETAETRNDHRLFLVWVYFEHERFESGFRDLTLCVKVLRSLQDQAKIPFFLHMIDHQELTKL